jgi:transcriptional regulator
MIAASVRVAPLRRGFSYTLPMTSRRHLHELISREPRSVSSLARELGIARKDLEADLQHVLRSAAARGETIEILPARCKACGFAFGPERLAKPSRCPGCKASRIVEAMIRVG